ACVRLRRVGCGVMLPAGLAGKLLRPLTGWQRTDSEVAEPDIAAVLLEEKDGGLFLAKILNVLVFAFGNGLAQLRAGHVSLDDFGAIQPLLDMRSFDDQKRMIKFAHGLQRFGAVWRDQIVEGAGLVVGSGAAIRILVVIEKLVFKTQAAAAFFRLDDHVFDAAVAGRGDFPVKAELEIDKAARGHQIPSARAHLFAGSDRAEAAVLDRPAVGGKILAAMPAPAGGGFAVK